MIRLLVLPFLFHLSLADITTRIGMRYSDSYKIKCDALPYRTVHLKSFCYFVIDSAEDIAGTTNKCSLILPGARLAREIPDTVLSQLFAMNGDFLIAGDAIVKKKAMCFYESPFPCLDGGPISTATGTCARVETKEEQKIKTRIGIRNALFYTSELPGPVKPGQSFRFKGTTGDHALQITINFQNKAAMQGCYGCAGRLVQFHYNLRWNEGILVLDNQNAAGWFTARENHPVPFKPGKPFDIEFRTLEDRFVVYIDGKESVQYKYRQPLDNITHVEFQAKYGKSFKGNDYDYIIAHLDSVQLGENSTPFPLVSGTANGFLICKHSCAKKVCKSLFVSGVVGEGFRFEINLIRKNGDYALHFNPRFDENRVIMCVYNKLKRLYYNHLYPPTMPFKRGQHVEVEIVNEATGLQIYVNGVFFVNYVHKACPFDINAVDVIGIRDPVVTVK